MVRNTSIPLFKKTLFINETNTGIYSFAGYAGYFLLSYYLKFLHRNKISHVVYTIVIAILIPMILFSRLQELDFYSLLCYRSHPVAQMSFSWNVLVAQEAKE